MKRQPEILQLPKISDPRGNLSFFENENQIPFEIRRVHWIYDVPGGENRGGLAYKETEEFIVAMSGSFDVVIDDGGERKVFPLNRSYMGVLIPAGTWRSIENFSTNSLAMIAANTHYDPNDAIRDYDEFLQYTQETHHESASNGKTVGAKKLCTGEHTTINDSCIIELDKHHSNRKGNITVIENGETIPFDTKRVYYLYDVPGGEARGAHAHKALYQLIIAASGSFTVTLDDGKNKKSYTLNRPYMGLLVKPGLWRDLDDFSSGSVCLVLASMKYEAEDYIRDYNEFLKFKKL